MASAKIKHFQNNRSLGCELNGLDEFSELLKLTNNCGNIRARLVQLQEGKPRFLLS